MKRAILVVLLGATTLMAAKDKKSAAVQNADAIYVNGNVYVSDAKYRPSSEERNAAALPRQTPPPQQQKLRIGFRLSL